MENSDYRKMLFLLGIAFLVLGAFINIYDAQETASLKSAIVQLKQDGPSRLADIGNAEKEFNEKRDTFADHWSLGLREQLDTAKKTFTSPGGLYYVRLAEAESALSKNDKSVVHKKIEEMKGMLQQITVTQTILGPPQGLYQKLTIWATSADSQVEKAKSDSETFRRDLDAKRDDAWSRQYGLTFSPAYDKLKEAIAIIVKATESLTDRVERGLIDKPLAYRRATEGIDKIADARTLMTAYESQARTAVSAVADARVQIDVSRAYIITSGRNVTSALLSLQGAESTLKLSEQALNTQQFAQAQQQAIEARQQALNAKSLSEPPTPTPVPPTKTPVPIKIQSDDDDTFSSSKSSSPSLGSGSTGTGSTSVKPSSSSSKPSTSGSGSGSSKSGSFSSGSSSSSSGGSKSGSFSGTGSSSSGGSKSGSWGSSSSKKP